MHSGGAPFGYRICPRWLPFRLSNTPDGDPTYDRLKAYLFEHAEEKLWWHGWAFVPRPDIQRTIEPHSDDFERHVYRLNTPQGHLQATSLQSKHGLPGLAETYFIKSRQDAEAYLSLPTPARINVNVSGFAAAQARMGDRGIVEVSLGGNPAGAVAELCGSTTFALMSISDRDVLHALCEREMQARLSAAKSLLADGLGPYFAMSGEEFIVPPLHGPADFDDFNVRYDRPLIELIHDAGGRVHIHCHGSIKRVMPGFLTMDVDVLHPFEAPPMGDITPEEARKAALGRICLEGNIQINHMYEHGPEQVSAETEALMATVFDAQQGLIVSPTASPYIRGVGETCFPQYKAMIDAVLAWRA